MTRVRCLIRWVPRLRALYENLYNYTTCSGELATAAGLPILPAVPIALENCARTLYVLSVCSNIFQHTLSQSISFRIFIRFSNTFLCWNVILSLLDGAVGSDRGSPNRRKSEGLAMSKSNCCIRSTAGRKQRHSRGNVPCVAHARSVMERLHRICTSSLRGMSICNPNPQLSS